MKSTNENAQISLINKQVSGDMNDTIEFDSSGNFYKKNDKFYITYKEHRDMGMGDSRVFLKLEQDCITMRRTGDFSTVMEYKLGKTTDFIYRVPFGEMHFKIKTEKIAVNLSESGGEVDFSYIMFAEEEGTHNDIHLNVKVKESE